MFWLFSDHELPGESSGLCRVDKYLRLRKSELAQRLLLHVLPESDLVQRLGHPVPVQDLAETQGLVMHLRGESIHQSGAAVDLQGYPPRS